MALLPDFKSAKTTLFLWFFYIFCIPACNGDEAVLHSVASIEKHTKCLSDDLGKPPEPIQMLREGHIGVQKRHFGLPASYDKRSFGDI